MRAAAALLLFCALAGCGEKECPFEPQSFLFDGEETSGKCDPLLLNVFLKDGYERGNFFALGNYIDQPHFSVSFGGSEIVWEYDLKDWNPREDAPRPWTEGNLEWHDETGPMRATSGRVTLSIHANRAIAEIEGAIARRDGRERPFTARLSGMLLVQCNCSGGSCDTAEERQRCAPYLALSDWKDPRLD